MLKILLLDGHTVQAFSVAKALKKAGIHITLFSEKRLSYGFASKYPNSKVICPSIAKNPDEFLKFFQKFLKENKMDVILPLFDTSANFVNNHREIIENSGSQIALPQKELFQLAMNKAK